MPIPISLFDSYQRKLITLNPDETVTKSTLKTYGCGPTVYNYAHIGNMRAIWLPDTITKVANLAGWQTEWISNITDVGHLVDDSDDGEDKMEKGAKRENKTVQEIVDLYTEDFKKQCQSLNFDLPIGKYNPKASEYAKEQMILALTLLKENKAYLTGDGIYLDYLEVEKNFENNFSSLSPQLQVILENQKKANLGNNSDYTGRELNLGDKKHPSDFALWKFVDENSLQKWKFEDFEEAGKLVEKFHAPSMHLTEDFGRGERGEKLYLNKHQLTEGFSQNLGSEELHSNLDLTKNFNQTPEDQKLYFITITTKNSRSNNETIQKSIPGEDSNKTTEDFNPNQKPVFFSTKERELLLEAFITKSEKENWDLLSVSILSDHLHFIIKSNYIDLAQKISELKGYGSFYLGQKLDKKESSIWNKKLFTRAIDTEEYLSNTLFYIENNFQKHQLQQNIHFQKDIKYIFQQVWSGLKPLVKEEVLPINTNSGLLTKWGCPGWHSECVCMISEISGKKRFSKIKNLENIDSDLQGIKAILIDVDGVLVQTYFDGKKQFQSANYFEKEYGINPEESAEFYKQDFLDCITGKADFKDRIKPYLEKWGWSKSVDEYVQEWINSEDNFYPNNLETLKKIRNLGIKVYLTTQQEKYKTEFLENRLKDYIDGIFSSCDIGYQKHKPEFWNAVLDQLDLQKDEFVFIDDTEKNIEIAKTFGINTVLYDEVKNTLENLFFPSSETYEIDIHTGGEDHIDIHHKNEIIQSEALGFNLSKTWVHNKFVLVNGKGMSKSVGNVYLVSGKYNETGFYSFQNPPIHEFSKELKEQITKKYLELKLISKSEEMNWESFSFDPLAYRLMLFEHHYSQQLNFTWEKLWQSQMRLWGMRKEAAKIESFIYSDKIDRFEGKDVSENKNIWIRLLINNLNFAEFIEKYNQFVTDKVNQTQVEKSIFYEEIDLVADFDKHLLRLQLFFSYKDISEIINLGTKRQKAKLEKNYQKADEMRTEIQKLGWQIDDYPWGWGVWWRGVLKKLFKSLSLYIF